MEIDRRAPVVESQTIAIPLPPREVWAVLTDLDSWPRWNPGVTRMERRGPVAPGTEFLWVGGGTAIRSRFEDVDAPARVVWTGVTRGIAAVHVWEFRQSGDGTQVVTTESFAGWLPRLAPWLLRRVLSRTLAAGLLALKGEAERRAGYAAPSDVIRASSSV